VHPDPAVLFGMAGRVFEAGVGLGFAGGQRQGEGQYKDSNHNGGSTHPVIIVKMLAGGAKAPRGLKSAPQENAYADGTRESRGLSVEAESKGFGQGFGEHSARGK